jgi:acetylornithine/N-succinyldiaminopimelate aminotransferase
MKPPLNPLLAKLAGYLQEQANAQRETALRRGGPVYDFGIGDPREPTPPFIRDAFKAAVPEVSQYPSVAGIPALRRAIAAYLQRRFALSLDPDREILPCQGAKEALFHLPLAVLDPARPLCWYPDPAYPVYERAILFAGGTPRTLPLRADRSFLPDLDGVAASEWRRTSLVYDNYPHNPTGAGAPREHHEKLAALAKEHGFLLVCDEPYVDLYVHERPHTALQVARENVLIVHSLSKRSGMTGYRSGFMAGEPELIAQLREARANFGVAPQTMVQQAAVAAWSDDAHVDERRRVFAEKRELLLAHLSSLGLRVGGEGAFYLWVQVPDGETSESYAARLASRGILVVPGPNFGSAGEGFVRLAMVPTLEDCKKAIAAWPV